MEHMMVYLMVGGLASEFGAFDSGLDGALAGRFDGALDIALHGALGGEL